MTSDYPEKRTFLQSTSDTDSDGEQEQGWDDVRLANQIGSGSGGGPRSSYITHDFNTFRARAKVDPEPKQMVSENNDLLRNEEAGDVLRYEGSSRRPSEEPVRSMTDTSSFRSSYRSQQSSSQPVVSESDTFEEEAGRRISLVGRGTERRSSFKSPVTEIDTLGQEVAGRINDIGGDREGRSSVKSSPVSEFDTLGEAVGGRNSYVGRGTERRSSYKSPFTDIDTLGQEVAGRISDIGGGRERRSSVKSSPISDFDTLGEAVGGRNNGLGNDSEIRPSVQFLVSDVDMLGEAVGGRNSYVGSGGERRSSVKYRVFDSNRHREEIDGRDSYTGNGGETGVSVNEPLLDEGHTDLLREMKRASVNPGRRAFCLSPTLDIHKDPESLSERARGRGSVSLSSRQASRVVSPTFEFGSDVETRERDEYGAVNTTDTGAGQPSLQRRNSLAAQVGERVPPEWALLLLGCLLGLATGLSVVLFNKGVSTLQVTDNLNKKLQWRTLEFICCNTVLVVFLTQFGLHYSLIFVSAVGLYVWEQVHFIHDMAWAGTPREGAAWLRLQKLIDVWHRVMLIPVVGGVVVGMMHAVVGILDQVKGSRPPAGRHAIDWLAGVKPTVKAGQAMVTLGTGCSLGPEGPSVDIGKAWAHGLATIMKNNRERRIALVAAGAAAGISAGFNAPVSGMFFAIETVLRPQHAENSPPLTTAMIILASVISSTVSQVLLEETAAFTVPNYELRSAAELPLYLLLGGVCGVVSIIFTRLTAYFTELFEFLKDRIGIPHTVTPAIGGLVTGLVALKYPGVLYWGFYNVDEILHSGKTATAPGAGLVTQLICAKVVATAFCKGSGLVGGVYAPSLFIGAAVGSVYGTMAGKVINAAIPGHDTVAHPQAYALVGMAALLAAVCSVPLTSVLLLFELTKDYHILLPLMGGIGVAIWVAAVAKQSAEKHFSSPGTIVSRSFCPSGTYDNGIPDQLNREQQVWRQIGSGTHVELCTLDDYEGPEVVSDVELMDSVKVSQAMSKTFVKVQAIATVKETVGNILLKQQRCALVVDENDIIEGIFTFRDLESEVMRAAEASARGDRTVVEVDKMLVAAFCSGKGDKQGQETDLVVCFPDLSLKAALEILEASGFKQLPVVARTGKRWQDEGRQIVGLIDRDAISRCIRGEASKRISAILATNDEDDNAPLLDAH